MQIFFIFIIHSNQRGQSKLYTLYAVSYLNLENVPPGKGYFRQYLDCLALGPMEYLATLAASKLEIAVTTKGQQIQISGEKW